jgi:hypothetical protein
LPGRSCGTDAAVDAQSFPHDYFWTDQPLDRPGRAGTCLTKAGGSYLLAVLGENSENSGYFVFAFFQITVFDGGNQPAVGADQGPLAQRPATGASAPCYAAF